MSSGLSWRPVSFQLIAFIAVFSLAFSEAGTTVPSSQSVQNGPFAGNGTASQSSSSPINNCTSSGMTTYTIPCPSDDNLVILSVTDTSEDKSCTRNADSYVYTQVTGPTTITTARSDWQWTTSFNEFSSQWETVSPYEVDPGLTTNILRLQIPEWVVDETFKVEDRHSFTYTTVKRPVERVSYLTATVLADQKARPTIETNPTLDRAFKHVGCSASRWVPGNNVNYSQPGSYTPSETATLMATLELGSGETDVVCPNYFTDSACSTITGPITSAISRTMALDDHYYNPVALGEGPCHSVCDYDEGYFCYLEFPRVFVYYWPMEGQNTACLKNHPSVKPIVSSGTQSTIPSNNSEPSTTQANHTTEDVSTLVMDGFIYTSPSLYLVFPTVLAYDSCGPLGPIFTSVTRAYAPGDISTVEYEMGRLGNKWAPAINVKASKSFDFLEMYCPPASFSETSFWIPVASDGAYNPVIEGPSNLKDLHPWWKTCDYAYFQGHDPPIALTAAPSLPAIPTPVPTKAPPGADPSPGHGIPPSEPTRTAFHPTTQPSIVNPKKPDPTHLGQHDPAQTINDPPNQSSTPDDSPTHDPLSQHGSPTVDDTKEPPSNHEDSGQAGHANQPNQPSSGQQPPAEAASDATEDPGSNIDPGKPSQHQNQQQHDDQENQNPPLPKIVIDGSIVMPDPSSHFVIGGHTYFRGGELDLPTVVRIPELQTGSFSNGNARIQIGGQTYTADGRGEFVVHGHTYGAGTVVSMTQKAGQVLKAADAPDLLIAGSVVYTVDQNGGFVVNGKTIIPGTITCSDPAAATASLGENSPAALTLAGKTCTADTNGNLIINGQTIHQGQAFTIDGIVTTWSTNSPLIVGGKTYTTDSSGNLMVDGHTIRNGQVATVNGLVTTWSTDHRDEDPKTATNIGDAIASAIGFVGSSDNSSEASIATGGSERCQSRWLLTAGAVTIYLLF